MPFAVSHPSSFVSRTIIGEHYRAGNWNPECWDPEAGVANKRQLKYFQLLHHSTNKQDCRSKS